MTPQEQTWLRQAQAGDSEAFAQLYQLHVTSIYRYLYQRTRSVQVAEDLTSEVFARALKSLVSYRESTQPFLAWLYRIAHARAVDYYRRQTVRGTELMLEDDDAASNDAELDAPLMRQQAHTALQHALDSLSEEQQQVIILRFLQGQSLEQTAQALGKNANAIKQLQFRAVRTLGERLQRAGFDSETLLAGLT
jgi:RNA polymerase sigma-70 factor (ECF subfamily)